MCANVGHDVEELSRVAVGALDLGDLALGSGGSSPPRRSPGSPQPRDSIREGSRFSA
jgi:hypothetical protein